MPDKPSIGRRGFFDTPDRQASRDEEDAQALGGQVVADPRAGAVFLSLVNRLSSLEAAARTERLRRLTSEERQEILVLDNEEAQAKIRELQDEIRLLQSEVLVVAGTTDADLDQLRLALDRLFTPARNVVEGYRSGSNPNEIGEFFSSIGTPFSNMRQPLLDLESAVLAHITQTVG